MKIYIGKNILEGNLKPQLKYQLSFLGLCHNYISVLNVEMGKRVMKHRAEVENSEELQWQLVGNCQWSTCVCTDIKDLFFSVYVYVEKLSGNYVDKI